MDGERSVFREVRKTELIEYCGGTVDVIKLTELISMAGVALGDYNEKWFRFFGQWDRGSDWLC